MVKFNQNANVIKAPKAPKNEPKKPKGVLIAKKHPGRFVSNKLKRGRITQMNIFLSCSREETLFSNFSSTVFMAGFRFC